MREILKFENGAKAEVRKFDSGIVIAELERVTKVVITDSVTIVSAEPDVIQYPTASIRITYTPN